MSRYDALAGLPLTVESYELERLELAVSGGFTRVTTVVRLRGGGEEGIGEDVTYEPSEHDDPPRVELAGEWESFDAFSGALAELDLFPQDPGHPVWHNYRRWGYESAALDLALRQAETSLAAALDIEPRPVRFVVSMRLGQPSSIAPLRRRLELYPSLRFKLDPTNDWGDALVVELAELGVVDTVDLKGAYRGTPVDVATDPALYRRVAEAFPDAWIEDPDLSDPEADAALARHRERITWDAVIHSVDDIESLPFKPRTINIKPSRFGSVSALLDAYAYCAARGVGTYGGGQFELGPGRGQIQYLASLFSPDAPNDVAPAGYHATDLPPGLPESPLEPAPAPTGFRWG